MRQASHLQRVADAAEREAHGAQGLCSLGGTEVAGQGRKVLQAIA